jgi:hypothetical protein
VLKSNQSGAHLVKSPAADQLAEKSLGAAWRHSDTMGSSGSIYPSLRVFSPPIIRSNARLFASLGVLRSRGAIKARMSKAIICTPDGDASIGRRRSGVFQLPTDQNQSKHVISAHLIKSARRRDYHSAVSRTAFGYAGGYNAVTAHLGVALTCHFAVERAAAQRREGR